MTTSERVLNGCFTLLGCVTILGITAILVSCVFYLVRFIVGGLL